MVTLQTVKVEELDVCGSLVLSNLVTYVVCLTHLVKKHKESHEGKHATSLDNDEMNKRSS